MADYNPYALVELIVNGKHIYGRPYEFDSDVVDHRSMRNAFGNYVKPTRIVSTCPDCGHCLNIEVRLPDPPSSSQPISYSCPRCRPAPPPLADPFVNPVQSGRIPIVDLDPLLHDPNEPLPVTEQDVMSRFQPTPEQTGLAPADANPGSPADASPGSPLTELAIRPAEGVSERVESNFDDSDLVDP